MNARWLRRRLQALGLMLLGALLVLPILLGRPNPAASQPDLSVAQQGAVAASRLLLLDQPQDYTAYLPRLDRPDDRYFMPIQNTLPWSAVGFIDNGCTGVLIDSTHVLAAAHCFVNDVDGSWQTTQGLNYFPNYNPGRANPVAHVIDRAVVGTRVDTGGEFIASDWGIGHLKTPVTLFAPIGIQAPADSASSGLNVLVSGYARDPQVFPTPNSAPPHNPAYCPNWGDHCWWIPALVDPSCQSNGVYDDQVNLSDSCNLIGGDSGAPVLWNAGTAQSPSYRVMGVVHGGGDQAGARRFQYAPRNAKGVAVATCSKNSACTQVFASDYDLGQVVSRWRTNATINGPFTTYARLGAVPSPTSVAGIVLPNGLPQVMALSGNGDLYTASVGAIFNHWSAWSLVDPPAGVAGFRDIDVAYDVNGIDQLYAVGLDGKAYTRQRGSSAPYAAWGPWQTLTNSTDSTRIAAFTTPSGAQEVFLVKSGGTIYALWQTSSSPSAIWTGESLFFGTGASPLIDVTANGSNVYAVDQGGSMYSRSMKTNSPANGWNAWGTWGPNLYTPLDSASHTLTGITSLTAATWKESSTDNQVVFAVDNQGNIYYTTYSSSTWSQWVIFQ
jgi:V8-like Glu-specific endopeptidase